MIIYNINNKILSYVMYISILIFISDFFQLNFFFFLIFYTIFRGSISFSDTWTNTDLFNILVKLNANIFRKPRSESEWFVRITLVPLCIASRTSWCNISPVRYKSADIFFKTDAPNPAQTATVLIKPSKN